MAAGKRHTLNNAHYAIHYLDRPSEKRALASADEVLQLLTETFGLRVPVTPALRTVLDGLVMAN